MGGEPKKKAGSNFLYKMAAHLEREWKIFNRNTLTGLRAGDKASQRAGGAFYLESFSPQEVSKIVSTTALGGPTLSPGPSSCQM